MSAREQGWPVRGPMIVGLLGLTLLLGGFGLWSTATKISGAIIAGGRIEVDQNRQVVQHPDGGVVAGLSVREGDIVEAGQVLLRLDDSELASRLSITESQLYELIARRGRLEAERDGESTISFDRLITDAAAENPDAADLIAGQERLLQARADSIAQEIDQLQKRRGQIADQINGI